LNSTAKIEAITHAMASMYGEQKNAHLGEKRKPKALFSTTRSDGTWRAKGRSSWRRARTKGAFLHDKKRWHLASKRALALEKSKNQRRFSPRQKAKVASGQMLAKKRRE